MQIKSLYIDNYKILKKFNVEFSNDVSIFVGNNGSGKSTILEAIALIFSDAIQNNKSRFGFRLIYELRHDLSLRRSAGMNEFHTKYPIVELFAEHAKSMINYKLYIASIIIEGKANINKELQDFNSIFPSNIVIYYSGLSDIMKNICQPLDKKLSEQYRKGNTTFYRPFFYFEPALFEIILISLLSFEYGDIPVYLKEKAKICSFQSIKIRLKKPYWAKQKIDKWWGTEGEIKTFLDFLDSIGTPLIIEENVSKKGRPGNVVIETFQDEYLNITIIGQEKLFEIREHYLEEKKLFKILNTLFIDDMWDSATFNFLTNENNNNNTYTFSILSEGEQQSIIIKGLKELVTSENTLFLFDEPDTYLHPSWQRNFINEIVEFVENDNNISSHFLIATHSPLLLSDADINRTELKIMKEGEIIKITPKYYGKDIATILYEIMGVTKRNKKLTKRISHLFDLIEDEDLDSIKTEYNSLVNLLGEYDPDLVRAKLQISYLEEDETNS